MTIADFLSGMWDLFLIVIVGGVGGSIVALTGLYLFKLVEWANLGPDINAWFTRVIPKKKR